MIPIQITNNQPNIISNLQSNLQSTNMGSGFGLVNGKRSTFCRGFNGNLNSWYYGLSPEYKLKMENMYNNIGILAQLDTVNSPYYTQVQVDENYIRFLQQITNCNLKSIQNY